MWKQYLYQNGISTQKTHTWNTTMIGKIEKIGSCSNLPTWANDEFSMSTWNKGWLKWEQSSCIKIMIIIYILPPKSWLEDFNLHGTNNYCPLAIVKKHPSMQKPMPMLFGTLKPTCLLAQWYTNQSQEHTSAIALISQSNCNKHLVFHVLVLKIALILQVIPKQSFLNIVRTLIF